MIYQSNSNDPFINLSLEHHLFETETLPALFLYQNNSCVVIGRAQNPWIETNLKFLNEHNIPLIRRQSGGGTVFHDLGNLNFTFFSNKDDYDKSANMRIIIEALASLNVKVSENERHDLLLQDKKISGSAYREQRHKAFHHATLLINSDLTNLRQSLKAQNYNIQSKGVPSNRSSVMNLTDAYPELTIETIINAIKTSYHKHYPSDKEMVLNKNQAPTDIVEHYRSDTWRFNQSLPFTETIEEKDNSKSILHIENGIIKNIESSNPQLLSWHNQSYNKFYCTRI